ncbi:hypothetical protein DRE_02615 [Drechslerella stenobrocha 248]|uniref:Peptidase S8/S53 domain-containing protein n=1 Tax=Drechslerella stenobrocha 248 TaxID=1043628 RepID=W7HV41_9PEZI|nr:hypothetical protein DRE_02615 [Drechslerella stenobrocha 248]
MKSIALLSVSLIFAVIPSASAVPASRRTEARWMKNESANSRGSGANTPATVAVDADERYIVVLADDEKRPWPEVFKSMGWNTTESVSARSADGSEMPSFRTFETDEGTSIQTFGSQMRAFTMDMDASAGASIKSLPNVAILEKDHKRSWAVMPRKTATRSRNMARSILPAGGDLPGGFRIAKRQATNNSTGTFIEQSTAPWNLQRISSANQVTSNGRQATDLRFNYRTHTAGTVGALTFGVAKNVNIFGAKAGDDAPSDSAIVAGLEMALAQHNQRKTQPGFVGSVISMSLGGPTLGQVLFNVLQRATQAGMHVSIAAGNDNKDACTDFPGAFSRMLPVINVGATDINDARAPFSNFGPCVDLMAPGVDIVSTFNQGPSSVDSLQGTSMACPAVTGMIAAELALNPSLSLDPAGMKKHILSKALPNVIRGAESIPAGGLILLNNDFPGNPTPDRTTL